jgi:hypothetical protein
MRRKYNAMNKKKFPVIVMQMLERKTNETVRFYKSTRDAFPFSSRCINVQS